MSFETIETDSRSEWLTARRAGIGASDIAGIMGTSPWTTPFQVWGSKVAELPEEEGTEWMRWGSVLETVILDEWAKDNRPVTDRDQLIRSTRYPILMATPDGLTTTPEGIPAVAEAKNRSEYHFDEIPEHYYAQVQWQLAVTTFEVGYLIVLHAGRRLETYEIEANYDFQAAQIEAATEFWKLVEADEAPPTEADDNSLMSDLWPHHTEQTVEVGPDIAIELYMARSEAKAGDVRKKAAEAALKVILGEADTAVVGQKVVATWREKGGVRRLLVKGVSLDD